ncbi:unnamed protein product [Timema podura]|uniref:Uncharacterized protein n=1 Tax=Timema podura TaxID=61482 RepID=A0ABN7NJ30_TIMPD|nr:unnamed protein product [Timema podura]
MKTTGDAKSRRAYEKPAPRKKPVPCFICDEPVEGEGVSLVVGNTPYSNTSFPAKIGQLMGDGFMVVVTKEDGLCRRCSALLNHLDKLEFDLAIVKKALTGYLKMKYQLLDEGEEEVTPPSDNTLHSLQLLDQLNKFSKELKFRSYKSYEPELSIYLKLCTHWTIIGRESLDKFLDQVKPPTFPIQKSPPIVSVHIEQQHKLPTPTYVLLVIAIVMDPLTTAGIAAAFIEI